MKQHLVAPSLLAADFLRLGEEIEFVNNSEADWFHLDVMDGSFVPNISYGMAIIKTMSKVAKKPLDVHLMIEQPEKYIEQFRDAGADVITVHFEACPHIHRTIQQIKATGAKAGVAINPGTSIDVLDDILEDLDMVLIMSVNPGFGGQKFIYRTVEKVRALRAKMDERNLDKLIEVDGGVGLQNAEVVVKAGANVLVAGSSVFKAKNPAQAIVDLKNVVSDTVLS